MIQEAQEVWQIHSEEACGFQDQSRLVEFRGSSRSSLFDKVVNELNRRETVIDEKKLRTLMCEGNVYCQFS